MNIETLHRAATAAGYAMAAPDDDEAAVALAPQPAVAAAGREPVVARRRIADRQPAGDALVVATTWLRSLLPAALGGRAPA